MTGNCIWIGVVSQVVTVPRPRCRGRTASALYSCHRPVGTAALVSASAQSQCTVPVHRPGRRAPCSVGAGPMVTDSRLRGCAAELRGRGRECGVLDRLIDAVRAGESRALVVLGEPGVGKSALRKYAAGRATGCRVARAAGVQSEMELAFSGLHQLVAPMLDHLERLPGPQRDALRIAFGVSAGSPPDRFLVGLAALGLRPGSQSARRPRRRRPTAAESLKIRVSKGCAITLVIGQYHLSQ